MAPDLSEVLLQYHLIFHFRILFFIFIMFSSVSDCLFVCFSPPPPQKRKKTRDFFCCCSIKTYKWILLCDQLMSFIALNLFINRFNGALMFYIMTEPLAIITTVGTSLTEKIYIYVSMKNSMCKTAAFTYWLLLVLLLCLILSISLKQSHSHSLSKCGVSMEYQWRWIRFWSVRIKNKKRKLKTNTKKNEEEQTTTKHFSTYWH